MTSTNSDDWSPADHPYAIAVAEAWWWQRAAQLAVLRLRDDDDPRIAGLSSRQIDARQLVFALRQLCNAEQLEQEALKALGMDGSVNAVLAGARQRFMDAIPDLKDMRDALMHFDEWARGAGRGPQKQRVRDGAALRDAAREFWGFGYDQSSGTVSLGPYTINVDTADRAAAELAHAIYLAAHEVDRTNAAELRAKTIGALINAGIRCDAQDAALKVSSDLRVWLALDPTDGSKASDREREAERIVAALASCGLRLESTELSEFDSVECLARGESRYVVGDA